MITGSLYVFMDKVSGRFGEIMHAENDGTVIRIFDRMFSAEKHNHVIRDMDLYRFADLEPVPDDPFPFVHNLIEPVCILSGADYYVESEDCDSE